MKQRMFDDSALSSTVSAMTARSVLLPFDLYHCCSNASSIL